jgi:diguanylate cyclase (GGDEF)-like protein/PAS domain S-box-containing protein
MTSLPLPVTPRGLLDSLPVAVVVQAGDGRIVDCNGEAERLLGLARRDILDRSPHDPRWAALREDGSPFPADALPGLLALRTGEPQHSVPMGVRRPDGRVRWLLADAVPHRDAEGRCHAITAFMEITSQRRLEAWQGLTLGLLDRMARQASLESLLLVLAGFVEGELPGARCTVQLLTDDRRRLRVAYSPSMPAAYLDAITGLATSPTAGSCGAAAALGCTMIVADVLTHPNWEPYRSLAEQHGFRACWSEPFFAEDGGVLGTFAIYDDEVRSPDEEALLLLRQAAVLASLVVERHAARENLSLAAALFEQGTEPVVVTDAAHRIVRVNAAFERLTGFSGADVEGRTPHFLHVATAEGSDGRDADAVLDRGERWQGELLLRHRDGALVPVWLSAVPLRGRDGAITHFLRTAIDLRETKAQAERIRELAFYDPLTRLANRSLVIDRLRRAIASAERHGLSLAVLFIDLDRFKEVNDTLGHDVGDEVLVAVARRFEAVVRREDTLGRLGGDEFIVIAHGAREFEATVCAERLLGTLSEPVQVQDQPFTLGASIGVALYPGDGRQPDELMKHADIAMYRAKAAGGGVRLYRPEMSAGLGERIALARDLRAAIRHGEGLALHVQPQVRLADGALSGAEVLLRWTHPVLGPIQPSIFIPLAEERSMMVELGTWVVAAACELLRGWREAGRALPVRLALNVSAQQLDGADAVDRLLESLRHADVPPAALEFELTESALMRNIDAGIRKLEALREAGISLAIDDFGTGYSSLSYLKRLPIQRVKIDMAFVRDMLGDHGGHAIVASIVGLAEPLGLTTVAEGVEHAEQADALHGLGCIHAQGYLFGRPLPVADFADRWLPPHPVGPPP